MTTKRHLTTAVPLACVSVLVTILTLEIISSTLSYLLYPRMTVTDPVLGWKYKPTAQAVERRDRRNSWDIVNRLYINKDGFRDDQFTTDRSDLRIMVLGDSMTFGLEVDQQEVYSHALEEKLRKELSNPRIDVMNFGITGYGTAQELLCLTTYEPQYRPTAVVLMMYEGNDFEENVTIFDNRFVPHFILQEGELVLHDQPTVWQSVKGFLRDHSTLFFLVANRYKLTRTLFTERRDVSEKEIVETTCHVLLQIHRYTKDRGIPLYVFYLREPKMSAERYDQVHTFAKEHEIRFHTIPLVQRHRIGGRGHWNALGHSAAAAVIGDVLTQDSRLSSAQRR